MSRLMRIISKEINIWATKNLKGFSRSSTILQTTKGFNQPITTSNMALTRSQGQTSDHQFMDRARLTCFQKSKSKSHQDQRARSIWLSTLQGTQSHLQRTCRGIVSIIKTQCETYQEDSISLIKISRANIALWMLVANTPWWTPITYILALYPFSQIKVIKSFNQVFPTLTLLAQRATTWGNTKKFKKRCRTASTPTLTSTIRKIDINTIWNTLTQDYLKPRPWIAS